MARLGLAVVVVVDGVDDDDGDRGCGGGDDCGFAAVAVADSGGA